MQHDRTPRWLFVALLLLAAPGCGGGGGGGAPAAVPEQPPEVVPQAQVPALLGLSLEEAVNTLHGAGFVVGRVRVRDGVITDPAVEVLEQVPAADTEVDVGAAMDLVVSFPEDPGLFLLPEIQGSAESVESAEAYYQAIDPTDAKTTFADWLVANNFLSTSREFEADAIAFYANDTDLGFGRRMVMRKDGARYAFAVTNYESLDDAIDANLPFNTVVPINTVAMEFTPGPEVTGADQRTYFTTFYAFDANGDRALDVDLDGRGEKYLPEGCLSCHGGQTAGLPGLVDVGGDMIYPEHGNIGAPFIPFDLSTFQFSSRLPRAEQEEAFRKLNRGVYNTFARTATFTFVAAVGKIPDDDPTGGVVLSLPVAGLGPVNYLDVTFDGSGLDHADLSQLVVTLESPQGTVKTLMVRSSAVPDPAAGIVFEDPSWFFGELPNGEWLLRVTDHVSGLEGAVRNVSLHFGQSQDAKRRPHVVELIEGWYGGAGFPFTAFDETFVPEGWVDNEDLYFKVVTRTCRLCHAQLDASFDFSTYDQFLSQAAKTKEMVFENGTMPLARRTFEKFWLGGFPPNRLGTVDRALVYDRETGYPLAPPPAPPNQAAVLAQFLYDHGLMTDAEMTVGSGRPIARIDGPEVLLVSPDQLVNGTVVVMLDGTPSAFDDETRAWSLTDDQGVDSSLTEAHPDVTLERDGKIVKVDIHAAAFPAVGEQAKELTFKLVVRRGGYTSEDEVKVTLCPGPPPLRFTVETVACEGADPAPKVYDALGDAGCMTCHQFGRQGAPIWSDPGLTYDYLSSWGLIDPAAPEAIGGLLHKGSDFHADGFGAVPWTATSAAYKTVKQWITDGALK